VIDDAWLYDKGYFDRRGRDDWRREIAYQQEMERVTARVPGGKVLDVGCGVGSFLAKFGPEFQKFGIDPSRYASEQAQSKGIQMLSDIEDVSHGFFDLIIFRGTLQHISEPIHALACASRILRSDGTLAILATPDTDSLVYKIFGDLPPLDLARNWVLFGHRMLGNILRKLNYYDIEISFPYWKTPYAQPFVDFSRFAISLLFGYRPFSFPGNMMEIFACHQ